MGKNDLGVDPDEWFKDGPSVGDYLPDNPNPLDSMPIARYHDWEDTAPCEYEPPDDYAPSEFADLDWFTDKPEKKEETMHEKMYKIATSRYNPFSVGGSENCDSDISCNLGGSEKAHDKD